MQKDEREAITKHNFVEAVWTSQRAMAGYAQQDAHEFYILLLNLLHEAFKGVDADCRCIIHQIFSGQLQSLLTCSKCGYNTQHKETFLDLSLGLGETTLYGCLQRYTRNEAILDALSCKSCGDTGGMAKQIQIKRTPPILSIQLKRFESSREASSSKIETFVTFPSVLDIAPYLSKSTTGCLYDLIGVVVHKGQINNGHYINYSKAVDGVSYIFLM